MSSTSHYTAKYHVLHLSLHGETPSPPPFNTRRNTLSSISHPCLLSPTPPPPQPQRRLSPWWVYQWVSSVHPRAHKRGPFSGCRPACLAPWEARAWQEDSPVISPSHPTSTVTEIDTTFYLSCCTPNPSLSLLSLHIYVAQDCHRTAPGISRNP